MTHRMAAAATPPSSANLPKPPGSAEYKYGPRTAPLPRLSDGRLVAGDATGGRGDPMNSLDYLSTWTSTYLNEVSPSAESAQPECRALRVRVTCRVHQCVVLCALCAVRCVLRGMRCVRRCYMLYVVRCLLYATRAACILRGRLSLRGGW